MLLSRGTAMGGILLAVVMLFMTAAFFSPIADFALFSLTSLCIAVMVIYSGYRGGVILYFAASVLIFAFFGIVFSLPFIFFFGIYPILKGLIESKISKWKAFALKSFIFVAFAAVGIAGISTLSGMMQMTYFLDDLPEIFGEYLIIAAGGAIVISLMIYDQALTLAIGVIGKFLPSKR